MNNAEFRTYAAEIIKDSLNDIRPQTIARNHLHLQDSTLTIAGEEIDLDSIENIYVVAAGKAAQPMAEGLHEVLGSRVSRGLLLSNAFFGAMPEVYSCLPCTHPLPEQANIAAADQVIDLVGHAGEQDLVICLISGGGSSILSRPAPGLTIHDLANAADQLMKAGAPIHRLNAVRKHLDVLKGGKLLRMIQPARSVTLCLSDVPGDDISVIASGPTAPDSSSFDDVYEIFSEYNLLDTLPEPVLSFVREGQNGDQPETVDDGDPMFDNSAIEVIGKNLDMLVAVARRLADDGYCTTIDPSHFEGLATDFGAACAEIAAELKEKAERTGQPQARLQGGETTVQVTGEGLGGRNSEVALSAARSLQGMQNCLVAAAGTDGKDGPTDAAGAIADGTTVERAREKNLDIDAIAANNDSYNLFAPLEDALITGPTGTNLMDIVMILARA